jgi:hypothetical protein
VRTPVTGYTFLIVSLYSPARQKLSYKYCLVNIQPFLENNSIPFPITFLLYIFLSLAMNTKLTLAVLTAAILSAIVTTTGVSNIAFADPPEPDRSCENHGDQDVDDKDSCPGGGNSDQEEICEAKNKGLQKKQCDD